MDFARGDGAELVWRGAGFGGSWSGRKARQSFVGCGHTRRAGFLASGRRSPSGRGSAWAVCVVDAWRAGGELGEGAGASGFARQGEFLFEDAVHALKFFVTGGEFESPV